MVYDSKQGQSAFNHQAHIVNILEGLWRSCVDQDGVTLTGIRGLEGVCDGLADGGEFGIDSIEMSSGSAFEPHVHDGAHILVVTAGQGELVVDGVKHIVRPGDTVFIAADLLHAVHTFADDPTPLRFLAIGYPHKKVYAADRMRLVKPDQP